MILFGEKELADYIDANTKDEVRAHWRELGKHFGYPTCCIDNFCNEPIVNRTEDQKTIGSFGHGFIPCPTHATMIVTHKIGIGELIRGRNPKLPLFPKSSE